MIADQTAWRFSLVVWLNSFWPAAASKLLGHDPQSSIARRFDPDNAIMPEST